MEVDVESIISETKQSQIRIKKMVKKVVIVAFLVFMCTVIPAITVGITEVTVPVIALFGMLYFFPLITFFLGLGIIWRKKYIIVDESVIKKE